ncbi:hypothetical protein DYQ05_01300 [Treponema pedis]|nr:hypothetical protein DYQ05_01300 [Treponema pedis]
MSTTYSVLFSAAFIAASSLRASCLSLISAMPIKMEISPTKAAKIGRPPRKNSSISCPQPNPMGKAETTVKAIKIIPIKSANIVSLLNRKKLLSHIYKKRSSKH